MNRIHGHRSVMFYRTLIFEKRKASCRLLFTLTSHTCLSRRELMVLMEKVKRYMSRFHFVYKR